MRVLVTGVNGQLGYDIIKLLKEKKIDYVATDINNLDITIKSDVLNFIEENKPTVIVHCAAYTAVDKAEIEKEKCYLINVIGTKNLAEAAASVDAKFVYISTDYVFDGTGTLPFKITDQTNPVNYYGFSKEQGELEVLNNIRKHYIIRTSWVFGLNGNNFVKTMLNLRGKQDSISVVDDQIGSPTYTKDLSYAILELIFSESYGIHHITNEGYCSWYEFTKQIFEEINFDMNVNPISTQDYKSIAQRPLNSRLEKNLIKLRNWQSALKDFLEELDCD